MPRLEFAQNVASQRLYFYPPEGRPTSTPSVAIKDSGGSTITAAATTNVTLDAVSTTVSVASSVGDDNLTLTTAASIDWRVTYLVTNSIGQKEWVRVKSCNATTKVVYFDEPLRYAYDTAATFVGTRFYRTLQTAEVDELVELYRARATYVVGGLNYVMEIPFDVVMTPLSNPLTVETLKKWHPDIMSYEPTESRGTDFADIREQAWDEVKRAIRQRGWRPGLLRTPEDVEAWAVSEFDLIAQKNGIKVLRDVPGLEAVEYLERERNKRRDYSCSTLSWMEKTPEDDALSSDEEDPLRMDLVR